jgi:SHS2 domain-containing protein
MAKDFWTFDHPADLGLEARADSLQELFEALGEGLAEQICPRSAVRQEKTVRLEVRSDDLEALAVDFLAELLRMFHLERFLVARVQVQRIDDCSVAAAVTGENYDPARHEIALEVKAVTYHQLKIAREGDGWTAKVIFDI